MNEPSDSVLVDRARSGDREAFGVLYRTHAPDLVRYLLSRTRNRDLTEDLCSESFLRAFKGVDGFGGGNFGAWLTRIARNLLLDHLKLMHTQREVPVGELWGHQELAPGPETLVLEELDRLTSVAAVNVALHELTDDQRTCLKLRFYQDHSVHETAVVMSRTEGAVKVLQHRAVRTLGEALTSVDDVEHVRRLTRRKA